MKFQLFSHFYFFTRQHEMSTLLPLLPKQKEINFIELHDPKNKILR